MSSTPRNTKGGYGGTGGPKRPGGGASGRGGDKPGGKPPFGERPQGARAAYGSVGAKPSGGRAGVYKPGGRGSDSRKSGASAAEGGRGDFRRSAVGPGDARAKGPERAPSETRLSLPRDERRAEQFGEASGEPRTAQHAGFTTPRAPAAKAKEPPRDRLGRGREMHGGGQRGAPDAPKGSVWLYGLHAVAAALGNPARRLRRLVLTTEAERALAEKLPRPWAIPHETLERSRIDLLLGPDAVHQGMALLVDPLAPPSLAQVLERDGPVIVLDQVTDPRNVGAILRSAAAFGTAAVITQERNAPEETGALAKAASGALESVPLLRAVNISRTLIALKAAGCWVVGLDASGGPLGGPALAQRRVALVLGSEGEGLRRLTRENCDELAGIAMPKAADMESLNVSAATAIALYELARKA